MTDFCGFLDDRTLVDVLCVVSTVYDYPVARSVQCMITLFIHSNILPSPLLV